MIRGWKSISTWHDPGRMKPHHVEAAFWFGVMILSARQSIYAYVSEPSWVTLAVGGVLMSNGFVHWRDALLKKSPLSGKKIHPPS